MCFACACRCAGWVIFSLRGPLKESYQADLDVTNPLMVVVPCLLMAVVAHPSTRHFILFRVRLSRGRRAGVIGMSAAWASSTVAAAHSCLCCCAPIPHLQILWAFCVYLEAVSVLPQLRMMQKAKVVEKFTAHYVFALGLSRFISCAHWILQARA